MKFRRSEQFKTKDGKLLDTVEVIYGFGVFTRTVKYIKHDDKWLKNNGQRANENLEVRISWFMVTGK